MRIDYGLIAEAERHYTNLNHGFEYIDVPWLVSRDAVSSTLPFDKHGFNLFYPVDRSLVGSAEQGFIQLLIDNKKLEIDKLYTSTTSCFRDDEEDELHQLYFVKNELFCLTNNTDDEH